MSGSSVTISSAGSSNIGTLTYSSSNSAVVAVSSTGVVTGKSNGNATITIRESNADTVSYINFNVRTLTNSVSLNKTSASLDISNSSLQLTATQSPSTVSSKGITWSSTNTSVATVNNNGIVTRVGTGTTTITAKATDGSNKSDTCTVTVKKEKMIIVGASTIAQLANQRKYETRNSSNNAYWNFDYYNNYGYTIRTIDGKSYYSYLESSKKSSTDSGADLFFVAKSGTGIYWLGGITPTGYSDTGTKEEGIARIKQILANNTTSHFTVAFLTGGNDLVVHNNYPDTQTEVENLATVYYNFYKSVANTYPQHTFYVFPVTPVDTTYASDTLKQTTYNCTQSNNTKRYRFATKLNSLINNSGNLKYASGFYNDLKGLEESGTYICYDGKHFSKDTCKLVLDRILNYSQVLKTNGKKK